jgi:hypothetical protein
MEEEVRKAKAVGVRAVSVKRPSSSRWKRGGGPCSVDGVK